MSILIRFHFGAIPNSPDFTTDAPWKPVREPSPWLSQIIAFPIGVVVAVMIAMVWFVTTPMPEDAFNPTASSSLLAFTVMFGGIVIVHELIHAAAHPMVGRSRRSMLGIWPSRMLFYAHYDGEMTRNRFVAVLLMPLLFISIIPLLVAIAVQVTSGWLAFISSFNAFLACVDMLGAGIILFQIPSRAIVRNQGWNTYWREAEE